MYVVTVTSIPVTFSIRNNGWDYGEGYFPRRIYYKKDALALVAEVERKGGKAIISKEKVTKRR